MYEIVDNPLSVAVLGLGEAGSEIAADLIEAGATVSGWDPAVSAPGRSREGHASRPEALGPSPGTDDAAREEYAAAREEDAARLHGLRWASDTADAVRCAAVVLSVNWSSAALEAAADSLPALAPGTVFADLNTSAPRRKEEVAAAIEPSGAHFADVALLSPVPGRGLATPALVSGSGAEALAAALVPLGARIETLGPRPGEAAERKLLRSVFVKGMAMAAYESIEAARAAGCEEWLHDHLRETIEGADAAMLDRLVGSSRAHARRRTEEMEAAATMLGDLEVPAPMSRGAAEWYGRLREEAPSAG